MLSLMADSEPLCEEAPCSLGIHPWHAGNRDVEAALERIATDPVQAIGEIGLDSCCPVDRSLQETLFRQQLVIAERRRLPVVLHTVRAFDRTMHILADYVLPGVIFHGFIGSAQQIGQGVRAGYFFSFGFRSLQSPRTVEALRALPADRLFLETDDAPEPVDRLYRKVSELLLCPEEQLRETIYENYLRLFGI